MNRIERILRQVIKEELGAKKPKLHLVVKNQYDKIIHDKTYYHGDEIPSTSQIVKDLNLHWISWFWRDKVHTFGDCKLVRHDHSYQRHWAYYVYEVCENETNEPKKLAYTLYFYEGCNCPKVH